MPETPSLSSTLRRLRERAGLSQVDAAARIGVHPVQLSKWERGVNVPGGANLGALAAAYGVPVDALMTGGGHEASEVPRESKPDQSRPPERPREGGATVAIPATTLAFWRGTIEAELRHLGGVSDTLLGLKRMLDDAANGIGGVLTSGVFQPVEHVRAPTVEDIVASWTPAEIQRAFAVVAETTESREAMDARLAQQPASDRAPAAASTPQPPAEAAPARRRRTG